jgi:hypothetical protein
MSLPIIYKTIHKNIRKINNNINKINNDENIKYVQIDNKYFYDLNEILNLLEQNSFIATQIEILIAEKYKYLYHIEAKSDIYINLLLSNPIKKKDKKLIKDVIKKINIFKEYFNFTDKLFLIIIPTTSYKYLPLDKNIEIGPLHVNSGSTVFINNTNNKNNKDNKDKVILLWREEELDKVLIHELIHYYKLDNGINKRDYQEAYTELMAVILLKLIDSKTYNNFNESLKTEIEFSTYQLAKLIKYWYPNKFPILTIKTPIPDLSDKISSETNVIGYYWIKTALYYELDRMLKFYNKYNFQIKDKNIEKEYVEIVKDALINPMFQKSIKNMYNQSSNKNTKWTHTLRMTAP